jgi:hypothetical protein
MAQPIEIPIQATGIAAVKAELRALRGELVNATDPATIERLSQAAGKLSDKIADTNEKIKIFAAGSEFEKVSNGLGLIGTQLGNLDFEGAAESAKLLTNTIKGMNPAEVAAGFKSFISTIGQLSNAFVQMGIKLLANPLFLLVAVIAAVVTVIVLLKDKVKILEQAFDLIMIPIKAMIQGLKDLGDWLGLTAFAEEEAAAKSLAATNSRIAANESLTASMDKEYGRQIALAKANGKDTEDLEIQAQQSKQNASYKNVERLNKEIKTQSDLLKNQTRDQQVETRKNIADLQKTRDEQIEINKDAANQVLVIKATANTKDKEEAAKHNTEIQKKLTENQKELAKIEEANARERLARIRAFAEEAIAEETKSYYAIQQAAKENADRKKGEQQTEIDDAIAKYDALILTAQQYGQNTKELEDRKESEIYDIKLKYIEKGTAAAKEAADAQKAIDNAAFQAKQKMWGALSQGAALAAETLGESTAAGKLFAIAAATINTYTAIAGQLAAFSGIPVPGYAIAQAIVTGAVGLAQVAKIVSVKVPGKDKGGSAPSGLGSITSSSSAAIVPSTTLVGNRNENNNTGAAGTVNAVTGQILDVRAYVSETEITDVQGRVRKMKTSAEL